MAARKSYVTVYCHMDAPKGSDMEMIRDGLGYSFSSDYAIVEDLEANIFTPKEDDEFNEGDEHIHAEVKMVVHHSDDDSLGNIIGTLDFQFSHPEDGKCLTNIELYDWEVTDSK